MATDPVLIYNAGAVDSPNEYVIPAGLAFVPTAITATFNGASASDDYRAALSFYSSDGRLINRTFPEDDITAGEDATVSYRPF